MALRKVITINEELCNGCGDCITGCAEGALKLVNGKAKLVKATFCDGFGDCIGTCPTSALKIEEKDCEEFDFDKTLEYVKETIGEDGVKRMRESHKEHEKKINAAPKVCPGTQARILNKPFVAKQTSVNEMPIVIKSEITQWPVQLHLVQPKSPFFNGKELAILSTCAPVSFPDVHWRYIRGRSVVVACPKLDKTEGYVEKLAGIFSQNDIPKVLIIRMEVPCCGGLTHMTKQALEKSGRTDLIVEEVTISIEGKVLKSQIL